MKLEGLHHITAITGDAPRNVDFYVRVLGLRMIKKTVNQDDPTVYHLFYGDDEATPGHDMTFFEYPGATPGRAGAGMVHTIAVRVASTDAQDYWAERLGAEGVETSREGGELRFADPEGLRYALVVEDVPDEPLTATSEVPAEFRLQGFAGVRAYAAQPEATAPLLTEALGFSRSGPATFEARGDARGGWITYDEAPRLPGSQSAGTVHHIAWGSLDDDHVAWRQRVIEAGMSPTPVIDRHWFQSVYFREPSGVLFELATMSPGFTVDEPLEHLGEQLVLAPFLESKRELIEAALTPLPDVRKLREAQLAADPA